MDDEYPINFILFNFFVVVQNAAIHFFLKELLQLTHFEELVNFAGNEVLTFSESDG